LAKVSETTDAPVSASVAEAIVENNRSITSPHQAVDQGVQLSLSTIQERSDSCVVERQLQRGIAGANARRPFKTLPMDYLATSGTSFISYSLR
jgi:hypothetical protein